MLFLFLLNIFFSTIIIFLILTLNVKKFIIKYVFEFIFIHLNIYPSNQQKLDIIMLQLSVCQIFDIVIFHILKKVHKPNKSFDGSMFLGPENRFYQKNNAFCVLKLKLQLVSRFSYSAHDNKDLDPIHIFCTDDLPIFMNISYVVI